ncbi:MAG: ATP-binding protein [Roseiflexaceae bacterium]|nr:ATP-binding protein [Roseiflexaceae bacterium]
MRRLWVQLTLAFALVTLTSVAVAALLANRQTSTEFRGFLAQNQVQESGLPAELASYYQAHGNWDGVTEVFTEWRGSGGMGTGHGMMRGAPTLVLANRDGVVVYDSSVGTTERLTASDRAAALPIMVGDAPVGFLVVRATGQTGLTTAAEQFLAQVNQALIQAGLLGAILGVLLGVLLARRLAAPLNRLAKAARQLAAGDLTQRVPVDGPIEVAAAGQAFNEMASALEVAEGLRQHMVADIAHELRTPLTVIQGNLHAILDDVYPLEKSEIQTILDETLLLGRLVDDLRDLALAEAGQLRLQPQVVNGNGLIAQGAAAFHGIATEKGVTLCVVAADDLPAVWADPERTGQVLHNLLANALRYTPSGGSVTLHAAHHPTCISDSPCSHMNLQPAGQIMFEVEDTGPGIAPTDVPHVFERFWRADAARTRMQGGSGLGLAIARQFVHAQGGQIGATSVMGRGSRFWFTVPLASETQILADTGS